LGILIPPHGGYRQLKSYQTAEIIYDFTVAFCEKYMTYKTNPSYRTVDQMIQSARSGVQNIAEGSQDSGTSKKTELKLIGVARGSLEELLRDAEAFLRQHNLTIWNKDESRSKEIRSLCYLSNKSYSTYSTYLEKNPETAANCLICLIRQTNFLLDRQLKSLEENFLKNGGFTEKLYKERKKRQ
jgi:restriction system protein